MCKRIKTGLERIWSADGSIIYSLIKKKEDIGRRVRIAVNTTYFMCRKYMKPNRNVNY